MHSIRIKKQTRFFFRLPVHKIKKAAHSWPFPDSESSSSAPNFPKNLENLFRIQTFFVLLLLFFFFYLYLFFCLLHNFYCHAEDEERKGVRKLLGCSACKCVAPVFVYAVQRRLQTHCLGVKMRQRKRWDLRSHLFTQGLVPEWPFAVVNHLGGDILKTQMDGGLWRISNTAVIHAVRDRGWKPLSMRRAWFQSRDLKTLETLV